MVQAPAVALRKESVDRNRIFAYGRRITRKVALRKESVDRNSPICRRGIRIEKSLSARRAWIEIGKSTTLTRIAWVALRKESVDRNDVARLPEPATPCRSPQGERG